MFDIAFRFCYNKNMKEDRLEKILEIVKTQQSVDIKTLMKLFYASEATIRRDLALLEQQGLIVRSRGKAVNNQVQADIASIFAHRKNIESVAKYKIAKQAIKTCMRDNFVVMLDASSTAMATIEFLKNYKDTIVVTSGIQALFYLAQTDLKYYSTGGQSFHKSSSFIGQTAIDTVRTFNADICFVSCHGLSETGYATDTSVFENDVRRALIQQSKRKVLLIDGTKINLGCYSNLCSISAFDDVFCNKPLPEHIQAQVKNFHLVEMD